MMWRTEMVLLANGESGREDCLSPQTSFLAQKAYHLRLPS